MKVALISFDFGEYCIRLASGIARHADTLLILPKCEAEPYRYLLDKSVELRMFDKPRLRQFLRQIRMAAIILKCIKRFNPDVIHLQQGHLWFNIVLPMLRGYPLVVTSHDPLKHFGEKTPQCIFDWGCHRAGQIIVHVPQMKDLLVERLDMPNSRVHVITHVLCGDDSAQRNIQEEEYLILFFGRITIYKGLEYLIRAEPWITARVPEAKIVIAGRGEDFAHYRDKMVHPERFIIHNAYISDEKRAELFRRASVVTLPYVEATQSGVVPVAYSFGKPVVATTVGGLPAQIDDGKTGYLVPPRDERALAEAIIKLLYDKDLRRQMGANGKKKLALEASPDIVAQATVTVYQAAVAASSLSRQ